MGGGLIAAQAKARAALTELLTPVLGQAGEDEPLFLVACSGGADSMALASTAAFLQRKLPFRAGVIIVDHQLQPATAHVSRSTVEQVRAIGLAPVLLRPVTVPRTDAGLEADARSARYEAFDEALAQTGARGILLGHTLDDQAEQVLLGLLRGSGTRSLAGMPPVREPYYRPLLGLRRAETEAICAKEGLRVWDDPTNEDPTYTRSKIRTRVLPELEALLGQELGENLARTAWICRHDADLLDELAAERHAELASRTTDAVELDLSGLRATPAALRARVINFAAAQVGAEAMTFERIRAVEGLLAGSKSPGPVQLPGGVEVWRGQQAPNPRRQNPAKYGKLVFLAVRS